MAITIETMSLMSDVALKGLAKVDKVTGEYVNGEIGVYAQEIITNRKQVSIDLKAVVSAERAEKAVPVITAFGLDVSDTRSLAIAYVSIKAWKENNWYGFATSEVPAPVVALRSALSDYLKSVSVPVEANALKAWLEENK